jgi:glucan endo-1,3-beta-D-glucosidase
MRSSGLLALASSISSVAAVAQGFNYGATKSDGYTIRYQSDFEGLFKQAKNLVGTSNGFTSARLYTTIQGGTTSDPTSAIAAAIAQDTTLLLTLWASGTAFPNELIALKTALSTYKTELTDRVVGIAVGSEDLYRNSPTGIAAKENVGAEPSVIADYINQVKSAIKGTALEGVGVGHVDTWTAWVNGSNQAVIDASDWIGVDAYPYFQDTQSNGIENGASLFEEAVANTNGAVGGKPVWITETGWPVTGKTRNLAVANTANAKTYWQEVGCPRFGKVNTFWYTLEDTDNGATPNPSFGVASGDLSTTPLFDLSCSGVSSSSSAASSKATSSASGSGSTATGSGSGSATTSGSSFSSAVASASSAAQTGGIVSSGGLSPSKAGGQSGSNATASSGSTGANSTGLLTTASPSGTSTGAPVVSTNAASLISASFIGVMGVIFAAAAGL